MFVRKIYRKALSLNTPQTDLKRIKLCIQLSTVATFGSILVIALDLVQNKYSNAFIDFIALLIYLSSLIFLKRGNVGIGKLLIFIGGNIVLVFNASREGIMAGNQFLFLPIITGPILLFSTKEKKYMITTFIMSISCIFFLESTNYSMFLYENQDPGLLYINYLFCFAVSLLLLAIFVINYGKSTKEYENKLQRLNAKLEANVADLKKANTELDSFVYKASHDLRSPLTSLLGLIELIKNEKDPKVLQYYLGLEEKIVHRLDNYIVDILNISRNARMPVNRENIDFKEIFNSVMNQLNFLEYATNIKTDLKIGGEDLVSDKMRVTIILSNLIANSIRYCDTSKSENWIHLSIDTNESHCKLILRDNGIGIKSEHMDKVFDMFYRATENANGSGLGLYIVKETIDKLKGEIKVNSEYGKWTEITMSIPNLKKEVLVR